MRAHLDDAAVFHHDDAVGALDGGQPVGDDQGRAVLHRGFERRLHHPFTLGIECAGRLVEQQQRRVLQDRAGDADALALAAGQAHAALAQKGVIALGQCPDELVGEGGLGGGLHLVVAGFGAAVADVFQGAGGEHHAVLWHQADGRAQVVQAQRICRHAVQFDGALLRIIKTQQQLEHRALARAAGADQGDCFAGGDDEVEVQQRRLQRARRVVELHALQAQRGATNRDGQRLRRGGFGHRALRGQQFDQSLGGSRCAQHVAVDLGQHGHAADQQDHIDDGLAQMTGRDLAGDHCLRALEQAP